MKVAGRRKAALQSVVAGIFDDCSYAANEQSKIEATIMPSMFMMDAAEFAEFKKDTRDILESQLEQLRPLWLARKQAVMDILKKQLEEDFERSKFFNLVNIFDNNWTSTSEFTQYKATRPSMTKEDKDALSIVFYSLLYPNYAYMKYMDTLPIYARRNLDIEFKEKASGNIFGTLFYNNFSNIDQERYVSLYVNRLRALSMLRSSDRTSPCSPSSATPTKKS